MHRSFASPAVALASLMTMVVVNSAVTGNFKQKSANDEQLVVMGGFNANLDVPFLDDVDVISIQNHTHKSGSPLTITFEGFGSTILNDTVYVVGGKSLFVTNGFQAYDIDADKWSELPRFPMEIYGTSLVL